MKVKIMNTEIDVSELDVVLLVANVCGFRDLDLDAGNNAYSIRCVGPKGPRTVTGKNQKEACEAFIALCGLA